jgi:GNAT superfamily N-acetyltransferase
MILKDKKIEYIQIKKWYLVMTEAQDILVLTFPDHTEIKPFDGNIDEYRQLNKFVGEDLGWLDRQIMADEELTKIIKNQDIEIYVLFNEQKPIGYTELNFSNKDEVSLDYFGLCPEARGNGFGKFLLNWTINEAWKRKPKKFKLNTCEKDHPNALKNYLKAGFKIVDERIEKQAVLV